MDNKGFTLTEMIVVLVILAVLAAFAIPTMLGFVSHAKESLCDSQRKDIVRLFESQSRLTTDLTVNAFTEANYGDQAHLCPGGGEYYGVVDHENNQVVARVYCTEHTTVADGRLYPETLILLDEVVDMKNEEVQDYLGIENNNLSNDNYRAKVLAENGGQWELVPQSVLDKTKHQQGSSTLRIQPYFFGPDGTLDRQNRSFIPTRLKMEGQQINGQPTWFLTMTMASGMNISKQILIMQLRVLE